MLKVGKRLTLYTLERRRQHLLGVERDGYDGNSGFIALTIIMVQNTNKLQLVQITKYKLLKYSMI